MICALDWTAWQQVLVRPVGVAVGAVVCCSFPSFC